MSAQLPVHWAVRGPWSVTLRPEFAWDRAGRWTGFARVIKAVTTTLEYRIPYRWTNTIARLEYRFDDSRGKGGKPTTPGDTSPSLKNPPPLPLAASQRDSRRANLFFHPYGMREFVAVV